MSRIVKDLTGQKFGRLTVLKMCDERNAHKQIVWYCKCECGSITNVSATNLNNGNTKSCGCLHIENGIRRGKCSTTHGASYTSEYHIWQLIIQRCCNPNDSVYSNYGGRGITVCDKWRFSFESFYADIGPRPSLNHSIDRMNNDGNYEPGNCKWSTCKEQSNNTRGNHIVVYKGKSYTIANLVEEHRITRSVFLYRLSLGWSVEDAIDTPVK